MKNQLNNKTIVFSCSDKRLTFTLSEFIKERLRLAEGEFFPFLFPGASAILAYNPGSSIYITIMTAINFLVKKEGVGKIVVIGHQNCRFYEYLYGKLVGPDREKQDTRVAGLRLARQFSQLKIKMFFASLSRDNSLFFDTFEEVSWE